MKKTIAFLTAAILMVGLLPVTALAHGHNKNSAASQTYTLCSVANCNTVNNHKHKGITYTGHNMNDGHDYHQLCNVSDCTKTGSHQHDGTTCLPHTDDDGHTNHNNSRGHRGGHH